MSSARAISRIRAGWRRCARSWSRPKMGCIGLRTNTRPRCGPGAAGLPGARALHAGRRDQQHLQARRPDAQGPQRRLCAVVRCAWSGSRHGWRRSATSASDGRPILGLDSRDLLEIVLEVDPRLPSDPRAHLDAVVLAARFQVRIRLGGGMLCRPDAAHLSRWKPASRPIRR